MRRTHPRCGPVRGRVVWRRKNGFWERGTVFSNSTQVYIKRLVGLIPHDPDTISMHATWTSHESYFSLSTSEGHIAGNILLAQSSSGKRSDVAASACKAALRACTKGSLNDRVNAAISTFCLVYYALVNIIFATRTRSYICTHIPCNLAKTYSSICTYTRLLVVRRLCEVLQEISIDSPIR